MRRVFLTLLLSLSVWSMTTVAPVAQSNILFRMNYAASPYPAAGWMRLGLEKYGQRWTAVHVPGGGPQGRFFFLVWVPSAPPSSRLLLPQGE